jgi:hypothetical protein
MTTTQPDAVPLIAIAGHPAKAKTDFRGQNSTGYVFFLITDLKWAVQKKPNRDASPILKRIAHLSEWVDSGRYSGRVGCLAQWRSAGRVLSRDGVHNILGLTFANDTDPGGVSMSDGIKVESDPNFEFAENSMAYTDSQTHDRVVIRINR